MQRQQTLDESSLHRIRAELFRMEVAAGELAIRIEEVQSTYRRKLLGELAETRSRLSEVEISLRSAREILAVRRGRDVAAADEPDFARALDIRVIRNVDGQLQFLPAIASFALQPGDIVEVRRKPQPAKQASACPEGSGQASCGGGLEQARAPGGFAARPGRSNDSGDSRRQVRLSRAVP
jgi:polysaccharide export outer membrane protein